MNANNKQDILDNSEKEEEINIYEVMNEIKQFEEKRSELDKKIRSYLIELGIITR